MYIKSVCLTVILIVNIVCADIWINNFISRNEYKSAKKLRKVEDSEIYRNHFGIKTVQRSSRSSKENSTSIPSFDNRSAFSVAFCSAGYQRVGGWCFPIN